MLVFDQFGRFRLHQRKPLLDVDRQNRRLAASLRPRINDRHGGFGTSDGVSATSASPCCTDDGRRTLVTARAHSSVRLRAYQVGFGDCLLLTVTLPVPLPDGARERHMLIDFGTVARAEDGPTMAEVAEQDRRALRRRSSTSSSRPTGTRTTSGASVTRKARSILDPLHPRVVVRPWTDVPESERRRAEPTSDDEHRRFLGLLDTLADRGAVVDTVRLRPTTPRPARRGARRARRQERRRRSHCSRTGASAAEPHYVKRRRRPRPRRAPARRHIRVLGPPTLEQVPRLTSYAKESEEYWLALAADGEHRRTSAGPKPTSYRRPRRPSRRPAASGAADGWCDELRPATARQVLDIVEGSTTSSTTPA